MAVRGSSVPLPVKAYAMGIRTSDIREGAERHRRKQGASLRIPKPVSTETKKTTETKKRSRKRKSCSSWIRPITIPRAKLTKRCNKSRRGPKESQSLRYAILSTQAIEKEEVAESIVHNKDVDPSVRVHSKRRGSRGDTATKATDSREQSKVGLHPQEHDPITSALIRVDWIVS